MGRSVNRATILGNVGADPEIRTTQGGGKVANFSIATTQQWNDAHGQKQEKTQWHRVVAWDNPKGAKLATLTEQYVNRGDKIYLEGQIEYRSWTDKDGNTRYSTELIAREITLLQGKPAATGANPARKPKAAEPGEFEDMPEGDDDLPF